jgi:hypothetical protein
LPEFPAVPDNQVQEPVVNVAPPVINDKELNVLQFADRTRFTGEYKKKSHLEPH